MPKCPGVKKDVKRKNSLKLNIDNLDGFTLVELLAVMSILTIILAIAVPIFFGVIERSRVAADQNTVAILNKVTPRARLTLLTDDPFLNETNKSETLIQHLVDTGHLSSPVEPQSKGAEFQWRTAEERWYFTSALIGVNIGSEGKKGWLLGEYTGKSKDITIPDSFDGEKITAIWQDVFNGKEITSLRFNKNSKVEKIHARAFRNNQLKNVEFPDSVKSIDTYSFEGNKLTKIKLPAKIEKIESHAFKNNQLTEVEFPAQLKTIGGFAFENNNLKKVAIGDGVAIGEKSFDQNKNLAEITIGNNAKIGNQIFGENTGNFETAYEAGKAGIYKLIDGHWVRQSD